MTLHPEVRSAVNEEYRRLTIKHPTLSVSMKLSLAQKMIRTLCDANTKLFIAENITITR